MTLIERAIRLPVTVTVIVALIVVFGLIGLSRTPVQLTPNVDQPVITVTTRWFGASPEEIVREIIEKQEKVLKSVSGLVEMTSQASEGDGGEAVIRLQFSSDVNKEAALNDVRDKLRQVEQYPAGVTEPVVESTDRFNRDYIAWMIVRHIPDYVPKGPPAPGFDGDIAKLGNFLNDFVRPALERAEGVAEVNILGGRTQEMQVRVDLQRLAARGISIDRLLGALRDENLDVTAGTIDQGKTSTSVRVVGQYTDPSQIENTVIAFVDGGAVLVKDVADVVLDFKKEVGFVRSKGENVVAINAQREVGSNVLTVMDNLKAAIRDVNENILGPTNWGIEVHQLYDQTVYIRQSVGQAANNLLMGGILAGAVLFITLRSFGATIVVMAAIPICVIGTFLGMALFGRSLNVISMAGLTFAIGMGIDNAIVVMENIFRHREMGKDRIRAAIDGAREVFGAIVAATLTNIAVFLPIVFIREEAGQLFRDIAIALSISFVLYLLVAPFVIPLLTTRLLRRMPPGYRHHESHDQGGTLLGRLTQPFARLAIRISDAFYHLTLWLTAGVIRRVVLVVVFVGTSIFLSFKLIPPLDYLPAGNQNLIFGFVLAPPGYSSQEFREMAKTVEESLRPWWTVQQNSPELQQLQAEWRQRMDTQVIPAMEQALAMRRQMMAEQGMPASAIDIALRGEAERLRELKTTPPPQAIDNFFFGNWAGSGFIGINSANDQIVAPQRFIAEQALQPIPGVFGVFLQASIFRVGRGGSGIELTLTGPDNDQVRASAGAVFGALMQAFNTFPQPDPVNFALGRPEVRIQADRQRAASAMVPIPSIRAAGQVAVDGVIIGDYRQAGRSVDLTVTSNVPREQRTPEDLFHIPLTSAEGRIVPLGSVAELITTTAPQQINRVEEMPAVLFNVQLPPGMTIQEAEQIIATQVEAPLREAGVIPPGMRLSTSGAADKLRDFLTAFRPGFILAALVTYLLLASLFENFIYPLVIIMSVPFAMVGGFLGLAILHAYDSQYVLNVLTMLGFVILIGTIVNSPILIVHQALNFRNQGMDRNQAIARSTQTRVRPIFMSVTTTVAGLSPLVLFAGAGSELYRGLGAVLVGGLVLSTIFTLLLTPTLMSLLMDVQSLVRKLLGRGDDKPLSTSTSRPHRDGESVPTPTSDDQQVVTVARLNTP